MKDSLRMHWAGCIGESSEVRVRKEMPLVREETLKLRTGPGVCGEAGVSVAGIANLSFVGLPFLSSSVLKPGLPPPRTSPGDKGARFHQQQSRLRGLK